MASALFYDINKTYEENFKQIPSVLKKPEKPDLKNVKPAFNFLGFPVNLPFGIPAGPLLNSKYIKKAFEFGFAVSTYKTVRSDSFPCHPFPNILYVKLAKNFDFQKNARATVDKKVQKYPSITITNSFGVPSKQPDFWIKDAKKALKYQKKGNLLIVSFMGTAKKGQTEKELIENFARTAKLAKSTGAKILEVNLSCPNIGNEGLVCYNLDMSEKVCKTIRSAIGKTPLVIKVGYYRNDDDLKKIARIADRYANAIAVINTIQAEILDKNGKQALPGENRLRSGVCGHAIKWLGLEMVKRLNKIKLQKKYMFEIIGIGGVMTPKDYFEYKKAGANLVQSATGSMWNPYLAHGIWKIENSRLHPEGGLR